MGTVWRAWDRQDRRWVAAKLLASYDEASLRRSVRERHLRVRHRHVVRPTDLLTGGFITIEDETAVANLIVWPKMFERVRPVVLAARYVVARGRMQNVAGVIHVVAEQLEDQTELLARLAQGG